jgi:nicotinamide-nucleotide amidase
VTQKRKKRMPDPVTKEEHVGRALLAAGWSLALAESCTGGLIGYRITAVPGSSRYFRGAAVTYEDRIKELVLGVRRATLRRHGAVSAQTAVEMARGARRVFGARVALSVTGIAGPEGGSDAKPVGLVYAAVAAGRKTRWTVGNFRGNRAHIRRRAADMALELLLTFINETG